jgi:SAM-dependent methyltransferase
MSPVRFEQPRDALRATEGSEFFGSELGAALEQAEMVILRRQLDDCFGARALLLGAGADERLLDALHVQRRFVARIADVDVPRRLPVSSTHAVIADPGNLPYANGSFDVVILFHALDLAAQPHQALREAERVLAPGGRLVITGFNPWSLWGVRRLFGRRHAPWNANFISPVRMVDWLSLLGFTVSTTEFACYRPPLLRASAVFEGSILRTLKGFVRMPFGGVWIIRARLQPPQTTGLADAAQSEPRGRIAATAGAAVRGQAARRPAGSDQGRRARRDDSEGSGRRTGNVFPFVNLHDRDG